MVVRSLLSVLTVIETSILIICSNRRDRNPTAKKYFQASVSLYHDRDIVRGAGLPGAAP
jgi:predicted protein tyrosine phosphatase